MQEKERHRRSPVSLDPACLGFVLPLGLAATLAAGGLQVVSYPSLSRAFTFNCCSGLGEVAGLGPQALGLLISVHTSRA